MQRLIYQLPKPRPDGQTVPSLTPVEFLERLATLIPPPRRHRHRYLGAQCPLRAAVTARAGLPMEGPAHASSRPAQAPTREVTETSRSPWTYLWAMLLARIYPAFMRSRRSLHLDRHRYTHAQAPDTTPKTHPRATPNHRGPPRASALSDAMVTAGARIALHVNIRVGHVPGGQARSPHDERGPRPWDARKALLRRGVGASGLSVAAEGPPPRRACSAPTDRSFPRLFLPIAALNRHRRTRVQAPNTTPKTHP